MMSMVMPPQAQNGAGPPMQQAPAQMPQQPPPPEPRVTTADPRAWAKKWKRPDTWTDGFLTDRFNAWDKLDNAHWRDWKVEAKLCYDVTAGHQWDKEAEQDAKDKSLTIVTINKVDSTVSAICGSEMTNRQEVRYYPRETSTRGPDGKLPDVVVNEILTAAAEWARDECDAADEESESFRDVIVCGIGINDTRMDYEVDPDGMAVVERCDPLEFRIDASSRRPNAADRRRITREKPFSKEEAQDKFGIDGEQALSGKSPSWERQSHSNNPGEAYKHGDGENTGKDQVWITEYQWWELEKLHKVVNPQSGQIEELNEAEFKRLISVAPDFERTSASIKVRRHYRAFRCGDSILEVTPLPDEEFTYKVITGKLDRNQGVWYGVVRAMVDPQRLLNKQVSQINRIIDTNAKGGLLAETNAVEDVQQFEDEWAASNSISWAKDGAVSGGRIIPKPISNYPPGIDKLLMIANEAVPGTSGVNNEMLGLIDREQAGVVDVQRKEAAYGVLKSFFNSLRRYRREHGRHLLKLITRYMSDERLIRIVGRNGNVQYVPLVRQPDTIRFDVIVDEAPTGPNQKDKVFGFLMAMAPMLRSMNLPPQILLKFMEFSPLPSALIAEVMQEAAKIPPQPDPAQQKLQADSQVAQAKLAQDAQKQQQDTQLKAMQAQTDAQIEQMKAMLKGQQDKQATEAQLAADARKAEIDAAIQRMAAEREAQIEADRNNREMALEQWKAQQDQAMAERQFAFEAKMQAMEMAFNQKLAEKQADHDKTIATKKASTQFGGDVG